MTLLNPIGVRGQQNNPMRIMPHQIGANHMTAHDPGFFLIATHGA
jgi:hypothetical protein